VANITASTFNNILQRPTLAHAHHLWTKASTWPQPLPQTGWPSSAWSMISLPARTRGLFFGSLTTTSILDWLANFCLTYCCADAFSQFISPLLSGWQHGHNLHHGLVGHLPQQLLPHLRASLYPVFTQAADNASIWLPADITYMSSHYRLSRLLEGVV